MSKPKKPTIHLDKHGWPIEEGDLLKCFHFRAGPGDYRFLYHVVGKRDGVLWAFHFTRAAQVRKMDGSCSLDVYMGEKLHGVKKDVEIIAWNQLRHPSHRKG